MKAWSFVTMLAFLLLTAGCQNEQTTRSTASHSRAEAAKTSTRRDESASQRPLRAQVQELSPGQESSR